MGASGTCPSTPPLPCISCDGQSNVDGTPSPSTPFPIDLLSGNKHFEVTDFANANRSLVLTRLFNSAAQTTTVSWRGEAAMGPIANPIGLATWLYDFQFELQITPGSAPSAPVVLMAPTGSAPAFIQNSAVPTSLTLVPYTGNPAGSAVYPNPQTDYTLSIVGSWPANLTAQSTAWTLQGPDDTIYTLTTFADPNNGGAYDIARPTAVQWRDGHTWTLTYGAHNELDQVQDAFGNLITFTWLYSANNTPQAIQTATLPSGYSVKYTYSTIGGAQGGVTTPDILTQVKYLDNTSAIKDSTTYQYNSVKCPFSVTGVFDANNLQRWSVTYSTTNCQATVSEVMVGSTAVQAYQVAYTPVPTAGSTFTTTVTNPLGKVSIYTYLNNATQGVQLTGVTNAASPHSPASSRSYVYGTDGFISKITDENGNVELQTHVDCSYVVPLNFVCGMPSQIVEAYGQTYSRTTNIVWDSKWHAPDTVTTPTAMTTYTFKADFGAVKSQTVTDETTFTTPYPTNGRTRTWNWTWNSHQLAAVHGPLWVSPGTIETTSFGYNAQNYISSVTNPLGQVTTFNTLDWRGAPTAVTDPNGVVTNFIYDIHGRILTATVNPGLAQVFYQFAYDAVGDLSEVTLPMGATINYQYDAARRLTLVTDVRGETRTFNYDNAADPLSLVTANSSSVTTQTHSAAYDEWGRIIQSIGAASQVWNLAYDNLNNLTTVTDPPIGANPGNVRLTTFDGLNRVIAQKDPESHVVQYNYDAANNLDKLIDARSLVTTRVVDGFGEVIQEVSPERGTIVYTYDNGGNLTKVVDGNGVESDHGYDGADRLTSTTYPSDASENVTYTWDQTMGGNAGIGRLTSVSDVSGSEAFTYDPQGRIVSDAKVINPQVMPFTTSYAYDRNGEVTKVTYPSGDVAAYTRTTDGLVTAISVTGTGLGSQTLVSSVAYEPFGPLASLTYNNGLNLIRTYDDDYRLTKVKLTAGTGSAVMNESFNWQADGRIAGVTDALIPTMGPTSRTASYAYTPSGRVMTGDGPWGNFSYAFDQAGNLTQNGATNITISPAANRVSSTSGAVTRALVYRSGGELAGDNETGGENLTYGYNAADRMVLVNVSGSAAGQYAYDFAGRRVWRETGGGPQTEYVHDIDGRVLAESNASGVSREYVWLDDLLIGYMVPDGPTTVLYVTTGQIDEPQTMTAANQTLAWNGYTDPFGLGGLFGVPADQLDLRLPGQWRQAETSNAGLSQNHWREYDPTLGRYTQPDRIGIDGGPNVYAYVDGDPLNETDLFGLFCDCNPNGIIGRAFAALAHPKDYAASAPPLGNKCNLFVGDVLGPTGVEPRRHFGLGGPISAAEWANPNYFIPHFPVVTNPQYGDIAAVAEPGDGGHIAFVIYPADPSVPGTGVTIGASPASGVRPTGWPWAPEFGAAWDAGLQAVHMLRLLVASGIVAVGLVTAFVVYKILFTPLMLALVYRPTMPHKWSLPYASSNLASVQKELGPPTGGLDIKEERFWIINHRWGYQKLELLFNKCCHQDSSVYSAWYYIYVYGGGKPNIKVLYTSKLPYQE